MRFTPVLVAAIAIIFCMRNTHALTTPPNSQQTMALCTAEAGFLVRMNVLYTNNVMLACSAPSYDSVVHAISMQGISGLPKSKVFSPTKQIAFWNVLTGIIRLQDILNDMREQVADPSYFRSRHLDGLSRILYQVLDNACDWVSIIPTANINFVKFTRLPRIINC